MYCSCFDNNHLGCVICLLDSSHIKTYPAVTLKPTKFRFKAVVGFYKSVLYFEDIWINH